MKFLKRKYLKLNEEEKKMSKTQKKSVGKLHLPAKKYFFKGFFLRKTILLAITRSSGTLIDILC